MVITETPVIKIGMDKDIAELIWAIGKVPDEERRPAIARRVKIERDKDTTILIVTDTHRMVLYRDESMNELAEGLYYMPGLPQKKDKESKFLLLQLTTDGLIYPNWKRVYEGIDEKEKVGSLHYCEEYFSNVLSLKTEAPLAINIDYLPHIKSIPLDIYAKRRHNCDTYLLVDRMFQVPRFEMIIFGTNKL